MIAINDFKGSNSTCSNSQQNNDENVFSFKLEEFPHDMILSILQYCDPRTMVNLICASRRLRILTIQLLLSGKERHEYRLEGVPIRNLSIRLDLVVNMVDLSSMVLNSYLDVLMELNEDELEMDRLNLSCCSNLKSSQLDKIPKLMNKFKIGELILFQSEDTIKWFENNVNYLKYLSKFTFVELESNYSYFTQREHSMTIPTIPYLKVLHGFCFTTIKDIENFCNMPYCSCIEELSITVVFTILEDAFKIFLGKCTNLRELNILIGVSNFMPNHYITIDHELVQIMRKATKLEALRLDTRYEKYFSVDALVETDGIFPNLKIYSNNIPTNDPHQCLALAPKHTLKSISVFRLNSGISLPKCGTLYLNQSSVIPDINCGKLVLHNNNIQLCNTGLSEILSTITDLRELHIHDTYIHYTDDIPKSIIDKTEIEKLVIEKSSMEIDMILQLIHNSPNLKELHLKKVKVTGTPLLEYPFKQSKLRVLHLSDCSINYSAILNQLSKEFNFPILESIVLENAYSVSKEILNSLLDQAPNVSTLNASGVEFDDNLIAKFLDSNKCHKYGIDFSFNGKEISLEYLESLEVINQITKFSLPDCTLDNDQVIKLLDKMKRSKLIKLQITLGKSGPNIELLKKVQEFKSLQMIYLNGIPENKIEGFESFVLDEFLISMPNLSLLYLESGEFSSEGILHAKNSIRLLGKSAPKLIVPTGEGRYPFRIVTKQTKSTCILN